jgi:hypothetical protein
MWAVYVLVCWGSRCEHYYESREPEFGARSVYATFEECDEHAHVTNFSNIVPRDASLRWECLPAPQEAKHG